MAAAAKLEDVDSGVAPIAEVRHHGGSKESADRLLPERGCQQEDEHFDLAAALEAANKPQREDHAAIAAEIAAAISDFNKPRGAPVQPNQKIGHGFNKGGSFSQEMTPYEKKMMKRIEAANRRAQAVVEGRTCEDAETRPSKPLPPPPKDGSTDHERAMHIAAKARQQNMMFYYYPNGLKGMTQDARELDAAIDSSPGLSQFYEEVAPAQGVHDYFEALEAMQQDRREEDIATGRIPDPYARSETIATSAGKKHEVVVDTGEEDDMKGT